MKTHFTLLNVFALTLVLAGAAWSQDRAALSGYVQDPTGAVIPGVRVVLTQPSTGFSRAVTTDERGSYVFTAVSVGSFVVSAEKEGFLTAQRNLALAVGQRASLDLTLGVQGVTTAVEVVDEPVLLDQTTAEVGNVITGTELSMVPLNGRNWASFMLLAPGAVNTGEGNQNSIRFAGRARDDNNFTFDGVDATGVKDPRQEANLRLNISLDAISEFRVSSSQYSAEAGSGPGAQMNVVSKSGTNQFHGGLFEFLRNDRLDARRPIDGGKPPFRLNQFGGHAGGPIVKNKTFFFGNYEGLRQRLGQTFIGNVPSAAYKAQAIAASPVLKPIMDAYKAGTSTTSDPNIDQLSSVGSQPWREDSFLAKVDHRFTDSTTMYVRYNIDDGQIDELRNVLLETRSSLFRTQNTAIQMQHIFLPSVVSETKLGMNRSALHRSTNGTFSEGVTISGFTALQVDREEVEVGTSLSMIQSLTWIRGRHSFKFGGEVRAIDLSLADSGSVQTTFTSRPNFIANKADSIAIAGPVPSVGVRRPYYFVYGQDEMRLRHDFTATIGLRYEYYSIPHSKDGRGRVFDLERCSGFCAPGTPWYLGDKLDFGPRIGFAWSPSGLKDKTVVHAGYGIFFGPGQVDDVNSAIDSIPETFALSAKDQPNLSFPAVGFVGQARSNGVSARSLQRDRREGYSQNWSLTIQQQLPYRFVAQVGYLGNNGHRLFNRTFVNVVDPLTGQRPFPNFSNIDQKQNHGNSNFNGLQVSLNRSLGSGFTVQSQYMWSHAINDNSGSGDGAQIMISNCRPCDHGNADWDVRHTLTISSVYRLPAPKSGALGHILGGWDLSGIGTARTGVPFNITVDRSSADLPDAVTTTPGKGAPTQRPNLVPGQALYPSVQTPGNWLNLAAFAVPAKGTWGNLQRNAVRGPGMWQMDLSLSKRIQLRENAALSFRSEFFNLFNRAQYALPNANISKAATFGQIQSVINTTPTGTGGPRQIQMALRLEF